MKWRKFTILTTTKAEDLVGEMLVELGMEGVEIVDNIQLTDNETKAMFVDILPEVGEDKEVGRVSFYLVSDDQGVHYPEGIKNKEDMYIQIQKGLEELTMFVDVGEATISEDETEDKDWANNWKQFFKPFCVNDIVIKPSWEEVPEDMKGAMVVEIDPGAAFGTGTHETTRLVILQIQKYLQSGMKMLDVGSGSGILSIIGMKLGAGYLVGTDLDPLAVEATRENMLANQIQEDQFEIIEGNIINDQSIQDKVGYEQYDLVTANILAGIVILLLESISKHMKQAGIIITSGIIKEKEQDVKFAFEKNPHFEILETTYEGEWVSITAKKVQ